MNSTDNTSIAQSGTENGGNGVIHLSISQNKVGFVFDMFLLHEGRWKNLACHGEIRPAAPV